MTIAQKLEHKARQEGLQKGEKRGEEKGEKKASLRIASALMDIGIDRETVMKTTGLSQSELEQIRH